MHKINQLTPIVFTAGSKSFINSYDKKNHKVWNETKGIMLKIRREIREHYIPKQRYLCAYCREERVTTHGRMWEIDHILPKSKMPEFMFLPENLIACCHECNKSKLDYVALIKKKYSLPLSCKYFTIIHPHYDKYSRHMKIYLHGKERIYKPITRKGWETFRVCGLDRFAYKVYGIQDQVIRMAQEKLLLLLYKSGDIPTDAYKRIGREMKESNEPLGGELCINVDFNNFFCSKRDETYTDD